MNQKPQCPSEYLWDRWSLGQLPSEQEQSVAKHVRGCEHCLLRKAQREELATSLEASPVFAFLMEEGQKEPRPAPTPQPSSSARSRKSFFSWWEWGMAPALLASLVLVFLSRPTTPAIPANPLPQATPKGRLAPPSWRVLHYRKGQKHSNVTNNNQSLKAGDLIQFEYKLNRSLHVIIVSYNDKKQLETFVPIHGRYSRLVPTGTGTLPPNSSLELDENLGKERLLLVYSKKRFELKNIKEQLLSLLREEPMKHQELEKGIFALELLSLRKVR